MTFQEAQGKFSSIISDINANMSPEDLVQRQRSLDKLMEDLPNTSEFDPIAEAITEVSRKLRGTVTKIVVTDIKSRDAMLRETTSVLTAVSSKAEADARVLTFEQPKLLVAALNESITKLEEIRAAAKDGKFVEVASKSSALLALVEKVRQSIKSS